MFVADNNDFEDYSSLATGYRVDDVGGFYASERTAQQEFNTYLTLKREYPDVFRPTKQETSNWHTTQCLKSFSRGDFATAEQHIVTLRNDEPNQPALRAAHARILAGQQEWPRVVELLEPLIDHPDFEVINGQMAWVLSSNLSMKINVPELYALSLLMTDQSVRYSAFVDDLRRLWGETADPGTAKRLLEVSLLQPGAPSHPENPKLLELVQKTWRGLTLPEQLLAEKKFTELVTLLQAKRTFASPTKGLMLALALRQLGRQTEAFNAYISAVGNWRQRMALNERSRNRWPTDITLIARWHLLKRKCESLGFPAIAE